MDVHDALPISVPKYTGICLYLLVDRSFIARLPRSFQRYWNAGFMGMFDFLRISV
jgi:hypothetical protein